jgi:phosphatidylglycerophosphatase A
MINFKKSCHFILKFLITFLATGGGIGYCKKAPGTMGSLLGMALVWPMRHASCFAYAIFSIISCLLAIGITHMCACHMRQKDPSCIVLDEIVGITIALWGIPSYAWWLGFIVFRVLDIIKPWPINWSQALPGGCGIVIDDMLAGIATCLILHIIWI